MVAANETDEEDADLENVDTENGVLPKALVKALKDERKVLAGEVKEAKKQMQQRRKSSKQVRYQSSKSGLLVIPAQAGFQIAPLDSRLRGNDGTRKCHSDRSNTIAEWLLK